MGTTWASAGSAEARSVDRESAAFVTGQLQIKRGLGGLFASDEPLGPIELSDLACRLVGPLAAPQPSGRVWQVIRIVGEAVPLQSGDDGLRRRAIPHPPRECLAGIVPPG